MQMPSSYCTEPSNPDRPSEPAKSFVSDHETPRSVVNRAVGRVSYVVGRTCSFPKRLGLA